MANQPRQVNLHASYSHDYAKLSGMQEGVLQDAEMEQQVLSYAMLQVIQANPVLHGR